jgi:tRNA A-37 threonylcarbamoyl transferase component Bud32
MRIEPGMHVGPYRVERRLGEGGMGAVWVAWHEALQRRVALKVLHGELAQNEEAAKRFAREAVAASRVRHPGVVEVYDANVHQGAPWLAMELLEGETLAEFLARRPLSPGEAVWLADRVLSALAVVHEEGLVHRDIKPENLFLERVRGEDEARVKILDFGIATGAGAGLERVTQTGGTVGTVLYLSPEQARGAALDARSDLYSFAVVLFEALSGTRPFEAESFGELAVKLNTEEPRRLTEVAVVPEELARAIDRALSRDPGARWPDAATWRAVLKQTATPIAIPAPAPSTEPAPPPAPPPASDPFGRAPTAPMGTVPMAAALTQALGGPASDPFATPPVVIEAPAPKPRSKTALWVVVGVTLLSVLGLGAFFAWTGSEEARFDGVGPLATRLSETSWSMPADPATGYRTLGSPFQNATVRVAHVSPEGEVAIALSRGVQQAILRWKDGRLSAVPVDSQATSNLYPLGTVTALAIEEDGTLYAGTRTGRLLVARPDGSLRARVISEGTTISQIVVSPSGAQVVVRLSGGDLQLGTAPLIRPLDPLMTPIRARIRTVAYLPDGRLVVGADAGTVFEWDGETWTHGATGATNDVQAVGVDRFGRVLAGDSRGLVHRASGSRWQMVGQVPYAPLAIRDTQRHGLLVIGGGGRIHATLDGESFSEMPSYEVPIAESSVLNGAAITGDNVAFWQEEGFYLFDGTLFRSSQAQGRLGTELELSACQLHRAAPRLRTGPEALFVCGTQLARFSGERLAPVAQATLGGISHPASVWVDLDADLEDAGFDWVGDALWRAVGSPPEVQRWDPQGARWVRVWRAEDPREQDQPAALSAAEVDGSWHVWLLERSGRLWQGRADHAAQLTVAADLPAELEGWCPTDTVAAMGPGGALVRRCGRLWRVRTGRPPEPFTTDLDGTAISGLSFPVQLGSHRLAIVRGSLAALEPDGRLTRWSLADQAGASRVRSIEAAAYDHADDGTVSMVLRSGYRGRLVRCRQRRCSGLTLPTGVDPRGVLHLEGTSYLVLEEDGLGILELPPLP